MVIYKIELNNKVYIGQTCWGYKKRILKHKSDLKRNKHSNNHLQNAYNKYGIKSFKSCIIDKAETIEELNEKEIFWIKYYNSIKEGYNIHTGGLNQKLSEKTKKKISIKSKETWKSNEYRKKHSDSIKKRVACYDIKKRLMLVFNSPLDASIFFNCVPAQINSSARTQSFSCGYLWKYLKDEWKYDKYNGRIGKLIWQYRLNGEFIKSYSSLEEASKQTGLSKEAIAGVANGSRKSHKEYMFFYEKQESPKYITESTKRIKQYTKTGEYIKTFDSVTQASEEVRTYPSGLSACLNGKYKTYKGYIWKYE